MNSFGFTVRKHKKWVSDPRGWEHGKMVEDGTWDVYLPHQCDQWSIAGSDDNYSDDGVAQDKAIDELRSFIAEAQAALESLKSGQEFGEDV